MKILLPFIFSFSLIQGTYSQELLDSASFDFWLGKWNLSWDDGNGAKGKGTNEIVKTLDGKVIQENFRAVEGKSIGFKGTSLSVYNQQTKIWKQAWVDNQGGYFDFTGDIEGEKRIFKTVSKKNDEKIVIQRMVFYNITKDSLTWDWEGTQNGGDTWNLLWRINYTRSNE